MATVEQIDSAEIRHYADTGMWAVHMTGRLSNGSPWSYDGVEGNPHTEALLDRFVREGGRVGGRPRARSARARRRRYRSRYGRRR